MCLQVKEWVILQELSVFLLSDADVVQENLFGLVS